MKSGRSGVAQRIDAELDEMIKKIKVEMGESYRAASKSLARKIKSLENNKVKKDVTF